MGMPIFAGGSTESKRYPAFYIEDLKQVYWLYDLLEQLGGKKDKGWTNRFRGAFGIDPDALLEFDPTTGARVPASVDKIVRYMGLGNLFSAYIAEPIAAGCDAFKEAKEAGKEAGKGYIKILNEKYPLDAYKPEAGAYESLEAMEKINCSGIVKNLIYPSYIVKTLKKRGIKFEERKADNNFVKIKSYLDRRNIPYNKDILGIATEMATHKNDDPFDLLGNYYLKNNLVKGKIGELLGGGYSG